MHSPRLSVAQARARGPALTPGGGPQLKDQVAAVNQLVVDTLGLATGAEGALSCWAAAPSDRAAQQMLAPTDALAKRPAVAEATQLREQLDKTRALIAAQRAAVDGLINVQLESVSATLPRSAG